MSMSTNEGGQLPNSPSLLAETWPNPRGSWCSRDGSDHDSRVGLVENILALILQKGYVIGGDAGATRKFFPRTNRNRNEFATRNKHLKMPQYKNGCIVGETTKGVSR